MYNFNIDTAGEIINFQIPYENKNIKINNDLFNKKIKESLLVKLKKINAYYSKLIKVIDYENQLKILLKDKNANDFDEKLISFMIIENEKLYKQTPRVIQIICLLYYLEGNKKKFGLILEVLSGEGKTMIISFLALYIAIFNKKVDILTSSPVLAERDAKNRKKFYERFQISCDYCRKDSRNIFDNNEKYKLECYRADVVYGDGINLIGDILRYEFMEKNGRGNRPCSYIIIDEIDNICIDNLRNIVQLIDSFPGFKYLEYLYLFIYDRLLIEIDEFRKKQEINFEKKYENSKLKGDEYKNKLEIDFNEKLKKEAELIIHNISKKTRKFLHENRKKDYNDNDKILIPENCYDFINTRIEHWAKMAYDAEFNFKINRNYIIDKDKDRGFDIIKPIDYVNTGVTLHYSVWSGLHQFLQIKEGLILTEENINSSYMSYLSFFKKYDLIFGITGTLGSEKTQKAINEIYKINLLKMPPFKPRKLLLFEPRTLPNEEEYHKEIINEIIEFSANHKQVVLVLFEFISDVIRMEQLLQKNRNKFKLYDTKIISYIRSDMKNTFLEERIKPNTIILSTNLSGRGTDIKIDPKAEQNGGLHVIITFMPYNERIEQQAQGRAARCGEKGSSVTIISTKNNYETLVKRRNKQELEQYKFLVNLFSPQLELNQKYFEIFCKTLQKIKDDKKIPETIISDLKERWSMFILKNNIDTFMNDKIHPNFSSLAFKLYKRITTKNFDELLKEININKYEYHNPFYQMMPNLSIENYERAIKKSPAFNIGAYYNQAYAYIINKKKDNYQILVYNNLKIISKICCKFIQQYIKYIELFAKIHKINKNNIKEYEGKTPFLIQCTEKILIMEILLENVNKNIKKLDDTNVECDLNAKIEFQNKISKNVSKNTLEYFSNFGIKFLFEIKCVSK